MAQKCSTCGSPVKGGHNARTCGKKPNFPPYGSPLVLPHGAAGKAVPPSRTFTFLAEHVENVSPVPQDEPMGLDEVRTWWGLAKPPTPDNLTAHSYGTAYREDEMTYGERFARFLATASEVGAGDETLIKLLDGEPDWVKGLVAMSGHTPGSFLTHLASDSDEKVRWRVADNINTPAETLIRLSTDRVMEVRVCVAENESTPAGTLTFLSTDKEWRVRESVVGNRNAPMEVLTRLATDKHWSVRRNVAGNHNTPMEVLTRLATDEEWSVRAMVGANVNTSPTVLGYLAEDDYVVRGEVAKNPNTPAEVLTRLVNDENPDVRQWALANPSTPASARQR